MGSRHGWTWGAALIGVTSAVAVPVLGLLAARTLGDSTSGTLDVPVDTVERLATTPGALLVAVEGEDVVGLTAFAIDASGSGGTAVVVPVGTTAPVDGFDRPTRVAAAYGQDGLPSQVTATEGLLGVTFSVAEQVDQAGLQALLGPLAPIPVELAESVLRTAADGSEEIVLPAGPQMLTAEQAAAGLFARKVNESEIVRLPDQIAIWEGIVSVADRVARPAPDAPPADVAGFLAALGAGPRGVETLVVTPALDVVTNPDGIDLLVVDVIDLRLLMARILPTAVSPTGTGLRILLVNRTGEPDALYEATARLQFLGANVVAVEEAPPVSPGVGTTLSYDPGITQEQVETLTIAVGPSAASPAEARIDGIDVTIDIGPEFLTYLEEEDAARAVASTVPGG